MRATNLLGGDVEEMGGGDVETVALEEIFISVVGFGLDVFAYCGYEFSWLAPGLWMAVGILGCVYVLLCLSRI